MIPNKIQILREFEQTGIATDLVPGHIFSIGSGKAPTLFLRILGNDNRIRAVNLDTFDTCHVASCQLVTILDASLSVKQ